MQKYLDVTDEFRSAVVGLSNIISLKATEKFTGVPFHTIHKWKLNRGKRRAIKPSDIFVQTIHEAIINEMSKNGWAVYRSKMRPAPMPQIGEALQRLAMSPLLRKDTD